MSVLVNLRLERKRRLRQEKERLATENRALYGRSKIERQRQQSEAGRAEAFVEGHRLEPDSKA
jgi:hypothetical protein